MQPWINFYEGNDENLSPSTATELQELQVHREMSKKHDNPDCVGPPNSSYNKHNISNFDIENQIESDASHEVCSSLSFSHTSKGNAGYQGQTQWECCNYYDTNVSCSPSLAEMDGLDPQTCGGAGSLATNNLLKCEHNSFSDLVSDTPFQDESLSPDLNSDHQNVHGPILDTPFQDESPC